MLDRFGAFLYQFDLDWYRRTIIRLLKRRLESLSLLTQEKPKSIVPISTQETEGVKSAKTPKPERSD